MKDGFIKVAAAAPVIKVADTDYNAERVIETIKEAAEKKVKVLVFPELTLTGCSCYDLYNQRTLVEGAKKSLVKVIEATEGMDMLVFVGLPFISMQRLYSVAAAIYSGELLGLVPRTNVKGTLFAEFEGGTQEVTVGEYSTYLSTNSIFASDCVEDLNVAVELGTDIDMITPPAVEHAKAGATIIAQMACYPMTVTSLQEAELAIKYQSKRMTAAIVQASPSKGESTTDNVYSGLVMIAEDGVILDSKEEENGMAISEVDVNYLANMRIQSGDFDTSSKPYFMAPWGEQATETELTRYFTKNPHLPALAKDIPAYCERMIDIQVSGLVKRMTYAGLDHCVVGISGGVDSTLCVMICAKAMKKMGLPSTNVVACTLPCFGTTSRTKSNAIIVAEQCGAEVRVIDIGNAVNVHFDDIGHARDDYSIAFENAQARERTQVLMDIANDCNGLDVGTEDLSEFVDGWCTYNGDHTSMYDVNMGLTKTQVRAAVKHIAQNTEDKVLADALWDVLDCPVTPELLPVTNDTIEQKSEENVGSYSLQDFFTHKMLISGFTPSKTFRLAKIAYGDEFNDEELIKWLKSYCKRLFSQQFKRSCLMDGPSVEKFSVSPRVGLVLPSDGMDTLYLKELEELEKELKLK